ncbi:MAG: hypothetical protein JNL67_17240 [Planctomycetaceae bacterium]|nr:hypothetical protein [Planctomycetaceae bacterium]
MSWKFQAIQYQWWAAEENTPRFRLGLPDVLDGAVDWQLPNGGALPLHRLFALEGHLKAGVLAWSASDLQHHVRGSDLILEYPYSESTPTGVECYWRPTVIPAGGMSLEWLVSANTRLLDENIQWSVASEFEAAGVVVGVTDAAGGCAEFTALERGRSEWESSPTTWESPLAGQRIVLLDLPNAAGSVAIATAAGDQRQLCLELVPTKAGVFNVSIKYDLQMGFLEKGVIRRARLWCLWLPSNLDSRERMLDLLREFLSSPQPLTV